MKKIFFLRHAKALKDVQYINDVERPLSEKGFNDAKLISLALLQHKIEPELIISSHAVRAYTTALIFINKLCINQNNFLINKNLYCTTFTDYLNVISSLDDTIKSVMLVGHNNELTEAANHLLNNKITEPIKTTGLVVCEANINSWKEILMTKWKIILSLSPAEVKLV